MEGEGVVQALEEAFVEKEKMLETIAGRMDGQTREDRVTQPMDHGRLR